VITSLHRKDPTGVWEITLFDIFHPGSIDANRKIMLLFARNSAGMTADTFTVVDDEPIICHASRIIDLNGKETKNILIDMRFIRITALLALFSIPAFAEINVVDGKISANFTSQPLSQAVQTIKQQSGIQINVDENVANETVSANFKDLPLAIGIKKLLEGTGINYAVIADADGKPKAVLISGSEKPGAPPKKLDTRPVAAGPAPVRSVVTPVNPTPPPVNAQPQAPAGTPPNAGMKPAGGVAPVGAPNANQQPNAINPMLKFDPNNVPTGGSLVPTVNTPQAQPPIQQQPNAGNVVGTDQDEDDEEE
jgi:hypothetical protein